MRCRRRRQCAKSPSSQAERRDHVLEDETEDMFERGSARDVPQLFTQ
jgi:hypothetical protein